MRIDDRMEEALFTMYMCVFVIDYIPPGIKQMVPAMKNTVLCTAVVPDASMAIPVISNAETNRQQT